MRSVRQRLPAGDGTTRHRKVARRRTEVRQSTALRRREEYILTGVEERPRRQVAGLALGAQIDFGGTASDRRVSETDEVCEQAEEQSSSHQQPGHLTRRILPPAPQASGEPQHRRVEVAAPSRAPPQTSMPSPEVSS